VARGSIRCMVLAALVVWAAACERSVERPNVVRIAYQHEMVTIDPHGHNDAMTGSILSAIYEPMVSLSPGATVRPCLAAQWTTPDDTTWDFTLRKGVMFHDGTPVMARDVVKSLERAGLKSGSAVATYLEVVESVSVVDSDRATVRIVTRGPVPLLLTRLSMVAILPDDFDPVTPVGTGPYRWVAGSESGPILLRRWTGYWGRRPSLEEVRIRFVDSEELLVELMDSGRLDVMSAVSPGFLTSHPPGADWSVVRIPSVATTILGLNVLQWPLSDPRVREAIDLTLDRRRLARLPSSGDAGEPAVSLVPAEVFGFGAGDHPGAPDRDRARRLLAQAGVAAGTAVRLDHSGVYERAVNQVVGDLAEIGLVVEVVELPYETFYRRISEAGSEAFVFGWNFRLTDASDFLDAIVHTRDLERRFGLLNGSGYANAQADRWIEDAAGEPRTSARLELMRRVLARIAVDRPYVPLSYHSRVALLRQPFALVEHSRSWVLPQGIQLRGADGTDERREGASR